MVNYNQPKILGDSEARKDLLKKIKLPHIKILNNFFIVE